MKSMLRLRSDVALLSTVLMRASLLVCGPAGGGDTSENDMCLTIQPAVSMPRDSHCFVLNFLLNKICNTRIHNNGSFTH